MRIRHVASAAFLAAGLLSTALAQTTSPSAGAREAKEDTAVRNGSTDKPGATGKTVVPGSNSSVASDKPATTDTKTGATGSSAGGK